MQALFSKVHSILKHLLGIVLLYLKVEYLLCSLFAVFDGHGGYQISQRLSDALPLLVAKHICKNMADTSSGLADMNLTSPIAAAFQDADNILSLETIDSSMLDPAEESLRSDPGSTAVVATLTAKRLTVANVGNSRAFLCSRAGSLDQVRYILNILYSHDIKTH